MSANVLTGRRPFSQNDPFYKSWDFMKRSNIVQLVLSSTIVLLSVVSAKSALLLSDLPNLSPLIPYTAFGNDIDLNLATVEGNTGVSANGTIKISGPSAINGILNLDNSVGRSISGHVLGGIVTPVDLAAAQALVISASNTLAGFTPDYSLGNVTTGQTFNSTGPVTVIDMQSLSLGGSSSITLNGGPNDFFILNVAGKVALNGSSIVGAGNIDPSHILINLYDRSGNLGTAAHINNVLNGTVLVPFDSVTFHSMNGAVWAGDREVTFMSGATLKNIPLVPEPSIISLLTIGVLLGGVATKRCRLARR